MECPKCKSLFGYKDGLLYICPECSYEWNEMDASEILNAGVFVVKDSNGNILNEGDDIILIKDLPLKGSSITLKKGSKSKNIRLVEGDHEIDCKVDGMKVMLKACFVKKA
jgi:protein PhnA